MSGGTRLMARWTLVLAVLVATSACSGGDGDVDEVFVSAAASLTDAFAEIEAAYEAAIPGVDVILNLAGSSALREQILEGAPVDVFASADARNMAEIVAAGRAAGEPAVFAGNTLQIAVPVGNPGGIAGLDDFAREDLLIGLCAQGVPCGDSAREALTRAGVTAALDTNEPDVRALLTKIEAGELDGGITYVTDVRSAGGAVEGIDLRPDENVVADYSIVVLTDAADSESAEAFVAFVLSPEGRAILADYGFVVP